MSRAGFTELDETGDTPAHHAHHHDAAAAHVRNLAIERLLRMNARHATHAWLQRRLQPVGPHGIAFLYYEQVRCDDAPDGLRHVVTAATRLVDDDGDVRDLPRLLYRLSTLARERYLPDAGGFDPLTHMTNRHDPMSADATYIGAGVSSLDTAGFTWEQIQHRASGPLDVPGRCYALLRDGSALLVERGGQDVFGAVAIQSTHDLNVERGVPTRRWVWKPDLLNVSATTEIFKQLYDLHAVASRQRSCAPRRRA